MSRPLRLLLIDPDRAAAKLTAEALRATSIPYILTTLPDGAAALAYLHHEAPHAHALRPDLILTELSLPGLSGLEVLAALKGDPLLRAIPVVVFTTADAPLAVQRAYQAGAAAYLVKSPDLVRHFAVVAQVLHFFNEVVHLPDRA